MGESASVERFAISGGGLTARIVSQGAAIQDLRLDGHDAPLVLGFADPDAYRENEPYLGAIAGRYANRIRNGRFAIDGESFQVERNFLGKHHLHGGLRGTSARSWVLADRAGDAVTLSLVDEAGAGGFPGRLQASVTYRVGEAGLLRIEVQAETDAPTLCNLTQHSYFNLNDGGWTDVFEHHLQIDANAYLPVDAEMIPTGQVEPVDGLPFDFRIMRPIRTDGGNGRYDHNFCLSAARQPIRRVAEARGERSGVTMEVWTTEPGLQFYSGEHLKGTAKGLEGRSYPAHSGFCLEAQVWPDSPNRPYFPQAVLRPGELYRQVTEYRFSR